VRELRKHIEWHDSLRQSLGDEVDAFWNAVPEETRRTVKVPNPVRIEPHQSCASEVRRDWIIGENDFAKMPMSAVKRPIAFHCDHAIRDDEMDRYRSAEIEDAPMDSFPVENILRPTVPGPGHDAEHVLHAEGDPCPMVRLDLGH
jgi:hypothetical protein